MAHTEGSAAAHQPHEHHITSKKTLFKVFGALVALTILTVVTARFVDLGIFNIPLALAIAGTKATFVVAIFMALKYDNRVNTLVFAMGSIFVVVFLTFTLFDTVFRGDLGNVDVMTAAERQRREDDLRAVEERLDPAALRIAPADYASDDTATVAVDSSASDTSAATVPTDSAAMAPASADSAVADTSTATGN